MGGHVPVVNTLLQYTADCTLETQHGSNALMFAAESGHCKIINKLLSKSKDLQHHHLLNSADGDGDTALHCSTYSGHLDAVKLLHSKGANVNVRNMNGRTALDLAIEHQHKAIIEYLTQL